MVPNSPADALGRHAPTVRDLLVQAVRSRHSRFAEAHEISKSRYGMAFGMQWRDLLDDAHEALRGQGFQSYKLPPANYKLPVVNDCLVYLWRVPEAVDAVASFASSPTKRNGFSAQPMDPMLFDLALLGGPEPVENQDENVELKRVAREVGDTMPLVLVTVRSSPRQLRSVEWAIAELDPATDEVVLRGQEAIWEPEPITAEESSDVESFDSGTPVAPAVELQKQGASISDA